jgi:Ras-related protein Rab-1A
LGSKSGKSSLVQRWTHPSQPIRPTNTIGIDMQSMPFPLEDAVYILHLWDSSGDDHYMQMYDSYITNSDVIVVVFDLTDKSSWNQAQYWVTRSKQSKDTPVCLIGNKVDLESKRTISEGQVKQFTRQIDISFLFYCETSAYTGENCRDTLRMIVREGSRNTTMYNINDIKKKDSCVIV